MKSAKKINRSLNNLYTYLLFFVILLVVGIGVMGQVYTALNSYISPVIAPTPSVTQTHAKPLELNKNTQTGMTTVTVYAWPGTHYQPFSFQYDDSWKFTENNSPEDRFTVSKDNYEIHFSQPAIGGGVCIFPDTDQTNADESWAGGTIEKTYVEVPFTNGTLRRHPADYLITSQNQLEAQSAFKICEKIPTQGDLFEVPLNGGFFSYLVPKNPNQIRLKEMDTILATISYGPTIPSSWQTYVNTEYGFKISYPSTYRVLTDSDNLSGWPNAIALLYNGGQAYDIAVEVWNTESAYLSKLSKPYLTYKVATLKNKFITVTNITSEADNAAILSSFTTE